jgi:hypothetical protein
MRPKHSGQAKASAERVVKDIRRVTRRHFSAGILSCILYNFWFSLHADLNICRGQNNG